jgi:hypothetical protein
VLKLDLYLIKLGYKLYIKSLGKEREERDILSRIGKEVVNIIPNLG